MANITTNSKVTNRDFYNMVIEMAKASDNQPMVDWANHQIELLDNKKANKKPSKATLEKRAENDRLADSLYSILVEKAEPLSIAEIKTYDEFAELTSSKIAVISGILIANGKAEKLVVKKVVYYKAV